MSDLEQIGLDAVDRFITTWNSRDAEAWAGSLNFPHVRPAPRGPINVAADAQEYISRVDFDKVVATGWDHSEWDYRQVLHTSPRKIHVVGQWSRFTKDNEKLLTNPVVYVVTCLDGHWGVQSRFSADDAGDDDTSGFEQRCFKLLETWALHLTNGSHEACAELVNYPFFNVGIGDVGPRENAATWSVPFTAVTIESMMALQAGHLSMNVGADLRVTMDGDDKPLQAVINITSRDGHLGIQAMSLLDPNEPRDDQS